MHDGAARGGWSARARRVDRAARDRGAKGHSDVLRGWLREFAGEGSVIERSTDGFTLTHRKSQGGSGGSSPDPDPLRGGVMGQGDPAHGSGQGQGSLVKDGLDRPCDPSGDDELKAFERRLEESRRES